MKSTVTLSKTVFADLAERGFNKKMIAKELGITAKLAEEGLKRWDLKPKRVSNAVIWDDSDQFAPIVTEIKAVDTSITEASPSVYDEVEPKEVDPKSLEFASVEDDSTEF